MTSVDQLTQQHQARRRAEVKSYSRTVRWMKIVLPVGALLLVGLIFLAGRERGGVVDMETAADAAVLGAGLRLDNPRFAGATENGEPFVVTADWALPDGAMPNLVELSNPAGEIVLGDNMTLKATAKAGQMFREDEKLNLNGDVVLTTSDGYRLTTQEIQIDMAAKTASAPGRLNAEGPRGGIEADSVQIRQGAGGKRDMTIRFDGNVHVTFRPKAPTTE